LETTSTVFTPALLDVSISYKLSGYSVSGALYSHIYDLGAITNVTNVVLNSVSWKGTGCSVIGCEVYFWIASATSTEGPWIFLGKDGDQNFGYGGGNLGIGSREVQLKIRRIDHYDKRYFRYKVMLYSSQDRTQSPVIQRIILNWSR
jgi:hypothetical protein